MPLPLPYPNNDLQDSELLLSLLGSFWSSTYQGRDLLASYAGARGELELQNFSELLDLADTAARQDVPVFRREHWRRMTLRRSEQEAANLLAYGAGALFGNQPSDGYAYSYGIARDPSVGYPAPSDLASVSVICSSLSSPAVTLTLNIDFLVQASSGLILFREDPFSNPLLDTQIVYDSFGAPVDTELFLWLFMPYFDREYVYAHFGQVLGLALASSQAYKEMVNILFDATVGGPCELGLRQALALMTGAPVSAEEEETVEDIVSLSARLLIVTDAHVYEFHPGSTLVVAIGDLLHAGDQLTGTVRIDSLNSGAAPTDVPALAIGRGLLIGEFGSDLQFRNQDLPTTVTTDLYGYTEIRFPLDGSAVDIEAFWEQVQANGRSSGSTLANLLDQRTNKVGQPTAENLPVAINPMQFLTSGFLRNVLLVRLDANTYGRGALGVGTPLVLRRLVPPQYTVLLLLQVQAEPEVVTMTGPGSATEPGYEESFGFYTGMEVLSELVTSSFVGSDSFTFS